MIVPWAKAFLVTLGVEVLVAARLLDGRVSVPRRLGLAAFAQLATHPLVWFVLPNLASSRLQFLVLAESWAVLGEILFYRLAMPENTWTRCAAVSALANGASFGLGAVLF